VKLITRSKSGVRASRNVGQHYENIITQAFCETEKPLPCPKVAPTSLKIYSSSFAPYLYMTVAQVFTGLASVI